MALRGDLASVDLAQVFQMLALNKKVGLLSIHSAKLWKVLHFDQRGVTVHHNTHHLLDRVVAAFVRTGRLDELAVDEVRDHAVRMGQPLTDSLLAGGYVDAAELDAQCRMELEEEVYDLFFCRDARFEFHEGANSLDGYEGTTDERFFFNCDSIIMEAARRIDEWAYISERIPGTGEVLVATAEEVTEDEFGSDGPAIFELLDGRRNVARIVELTGLTNFQVCKPLSMMLDSDVVAPVAPEELVELGNECMSEGRLPDAISLYERAIEVGIGLPDTHALAAKAYQTAEEYELAIFHLQSEAEFRIGDEDFEGAARCLLEVKTLVPTDLKARERLVELTLGPDAVGIDGFDALAEGKELVELMTEFGDVQRVRTLLERLLTVEPNDPDLKKALVNVHVRAGDQKRVVQLYESIADDLVRQGKPLEAVGYLQKILQIDRSRSDVSEKVRRLYEFDERARKRSRALSVLAVLFCVLLVLGSGYWFYNDRAETEFGKLDVSELLAHEDFVGASAVFKEFIVQHPLTTAVQKAEAELQRVESAQQLFEARRKSEQAERLAEMKGVRDRYKIAWNQHREHFLAGNPEAAFEALVKVRELVQQAGATVDMEWALEQQVERSWKNLGDYLAESRRLGKLYDGKLAAGDWAGAREAALRLQADYENTECGRRVLVPVQVVTRPAGALLEHGGKPLMRTVDGKQEQVRSPGLVLCKASQPVSIKAVMPGFEPRDIVVDGKKHAKVVVVLAVVPDRKVAFGHAGQTAAGLDDDWIAIGLRGGKLGVARVDGRDKRVHELSELKSVYSDPVVQSGRVFFVSNESTVECVAIDPAAKVTGWPYKLQSEAITPLAIGDGRLAVVDSANVMHCWEQSTGRRLWGIALGSKPSGPPAIARRRAFIGTKDGRVLAFDVIDGKSLGVLRSPAGITTQIHVAGKQVFFGCEDGAVRAVDFDNGKVRWSQSVGHVVSGRQLAIGPGLVVVATPGKVLAFDRDSGKPIGEMATEDTVLGVGVHGRLVLSQVRRQQDKRNPARDVLVACAADSMEIMWEYALPAVAPGLFTVRDGVVSLPTETGEVVLFR